MAARDHRPRPHPPPEHPRPAARRPGRPDGRRGHPRRPHPRRVAARPSTRQDRSWSFHPGQLVIVDEASLAGTRTLDALLTQAQDAGAKLLLVGDHHQLTSVDAGGAFTLLTTRGTASELTSLWRFTNRWEAHATRALRHGDPTALDTYTAHGRIQHGPADEVLETAYTAWQHDTDTGLASLLIAPDADTVTALNTRAHTDRQAIGHVTGPVITLDHPATGHRGQVGAGDRIVTRRNNRQLRTPGGGHVRNGDLWTITHVHPDGALSVTPTHHGHPGPAAGEAPDRAVSASEPAVLLPAEYVTEHVDPGYATTAHRAQGITVDTAHALTTPAATRETLYVAMTRGRHANHLYLTTDTPHPDCHQRPRHGPSASAGGQTPTDPHRDPRPQRRRNLRHPGHHRRPRRRHRPDPAHRHPRHPLADAAGRDRYRP